MFSYEKLYISRNINNVNIDNYISNHRLLLRKNIEINFLLLKNVEMLFNMKSNKGPKTNFVKDVEILPPVKFRWIPFREVESIWAN